MDHMTRTNAAPTRMTQHHTAHRTGVQSSGVQRPKVQRPMRPRFMPRLLDRVLALAGLVGLCSFLFAAPAAAWWNDDWSLRKKITLDTSASGANITDPIGTLAVLVRLHSGNFRFAQAKDDGADIRFVAGDDKTPLKFHVEGYDSLLDQAFVWVQVPDLKPGSKTDIWLYYGNKKAVAAGDAKATYDAPTVLVYHFSEHGTPAQDASVWANGAQSTGQRPKAR